jgi:4-hydroxyproline epimerase
MSRHSFFCIDAHTCGNPVRVVAGGGPRLRGRSLSDYRQDFVANHDWVRRSLMFEPRGHAVMSGSILYPPFDEANDLGVLFIEVTGCLPMCGHGTIGTVTVALEHGLVTPREPGRLRLEVPAGLVTAEYRQEGDHIEAVKITNVASYLHLAGVAVECPELGPIAVDIAYGGNFYAIVDPQPNFPGLEAVSVDQLLRWSPVLRQRLNGQIDVRHPTDRRIKGISHLMWTGRPGPEADGRNAVFYGQRAIDRSPCGTGTSARMAQLHARGMLHAGERFVHESIIGSRFIGRVEAETELAGRPAIIPSIEGWARITGLNTILVDEHDPFAHGFEVV